MSSLTTVTLRKRVEGLQVYWRYGQMPSNVELVTIQTGEQESAYPHSCERCAHVFRNEARYKWRLQPDGSRKYLRGMFWTTHCRDCLITTKQQWIQALEALQV